MKYIQKAANKNDMLRVFCFPYAGGGASIYRKWQTYFGDKIGIYPIQLPGREDRIMDPPVDDINIFIKEVTQELSDYKEKTCIFFGHSLGGRLAYAIASQSAEVVPIKSLIVSASPAPDCEVKKVSQLDDEKFVKELIRLNATPKEIIDNKEILKLFMPMLKADYKLDDSVDYKSFGILNIDIWGIQGSEDTEVGKEDLRKWDKYTTREFRLKTIEGNHFFVKNEMILRYIKDIIQFYL